MWIRVHNGTYGYGKVHVISDRILPHRIPNVYGALTSVAMDALCASPTFAAACALAADSSAAAAMASCAMADAFSPSAFATLRRRHWQAKLTQAKLKQRQPHPLHFELYPHAADPGLQLSHSSSSLWHLMCAMAQEVQWHLHAGSASACQSDNVRPKCHHCGTARRLSKAQGASYNDAGQ